MDCWTMAVDDGLMTLRILRSWTAEKSVHGE